MAIIDRKLNEEAQREAAEYAERNDTAAAPHWDESMPPPPTYEEAVPSSSTGSPAQGQNGRQNTSEASAASSSSRDPRRSRRSERLSTDTDSVESDESMPLLTNRQKRRLKRKMRSVDRMKKGCRFIGASLLLACVVVLILKLVRLSRREIIKPDIPDSDGDAIEDPVWSSPIKTPPDMWPNPYSPLYSSQANFSFSAFDDFFLHAKGALSTYGGEATVSNADVFDDADWTSLNQGTFIDRIFVTVETRFNDVSLRDCLRVNKMRTNAHKKGLGIYGAAEEHTKRNTFLSVHVNVYLPSSRQRSSAGLAKDKSSFIHEVELALDNLSLHIEQLYKSVDERSNDASITLGRLHTEQFNGGINIVGSLVANHSVSLKLGNGNVLDLNPSSGVSIKSPLIGINVANGPIWLSKLVAEKEIILQTANGEVNITDIAIADSIEINSDSGTIGGRYQTSDLKIYSASGSTVIDFDMGSDPDTSSKQIRCHQRNITIFNKLGEVDVRFKNHRNNVLLNSNITSVAGSAAIYHDAGYEGSFQGSNTLGIIKVRGPKDDIVVDSYTSNTATNRQTDDLSTNDAVERSKRFVVTKNNGGPFGSKRVVGKAWWSDHDWNDERVFCKSTSFAKSTLGTLLMEF